MNSGKEMWLREVRAIPTEQAVEVLARYVLDLEEKIRQMESREIQLTGVSWWGFGTIRVKL